MDATVFLEQLAKEAHYSSQTKELINKQPEKLQEAIKTSNATLIQSYFSDTAYLAHGTAAVEIKLDKI